MHRDIKPGNILWLPRRRSWTLIDFGCAAATGSHAPTGFSLYYAAPEAINAYTSEQGGLVATEALDAWSLGVLAIELFTGQPVFLLILPEQVRSILYFQGLLYLVHRFISKPSCAMSDTLW